MNVTFSVIGLTRPCIEPEFTAPEVDYPLDHMIGLKVRFKTLTIFFTTWHLAACDLRMMNRMLTMRMQLNMFSCVVLLSLNCDLFI